MKSGLLIMCCLFTLGIKAQTVDSRGIYANKQELENIEIGWLNPLVLNDAAKPYVKNGWDYPVNQIEASRKMAGWLQQTYTPTGMLGEMKLSILAPEASKYRGTKSYDFGEAEKDNRFALPNTYGSYAKFHQCLFKTATHKFWPTPGNHCYNTLDIMANNVEAITKQIIGLSTTTDYYCTMPDYTIGQNGIYEKDWLNELAVYRNFTASPQLQPYMHYFLPASKELAYVVIMTKNGEPLPFEQVTAATFIAQVENQLPLLLQFAANRHLIYENYQQNARKGIQVLKEQLKNKLNEYVFFPDFERQIDILDLADIGSAGKLPNWILTEKMTTNRNDFGNVRSTNKNYPLLRLKKGVKEACAKTGPQWIVFKLTDPIDHSYGGSIQQMDNFVSRFNYAYVYDYFFGKEKPTAPYKPISFLNAEQAGHKKATAEMSAITQQKAADKSILFFDDFSTVADGASPAEWSTTRSTSGDRQMVTTAKEGTGKWLKLKGTASPKKLQLPISGDFEISYDLLVHKGDVPWGTPGIDIELGFSTKEGDKRYTINVSPGDMNRADAAGWIMLALGGTTACKVSSYYSIPAFTGSKPVNQVTITIRKKGESITVLSNNEKVYDCNAAFAPGATLKKLHFYVNEKNVYYLGNVQLKKL